MLFSGRSMDIPAYLAKHKLSQKQFGERIGVSAGAVWQWLNGYARMSGEKAEEIVRTTHGEITQRDLWKYLVGKIKAA
jgi:DNA-binding transcriptional regulator YdaS (Cro superfamily)